jgi:hypothetical protein
LKELARDAREVVVCDACVLINFAIVDRIDALERQQLEHSAQSRVVLDAIRSLLA